MLSGIANTDKQYGYCRLAASVMLLTGNAFKSQIFTSFIRCDNIIQK